MQERTSEILEVGILADLVEVSDVDTDLVVVSDVDTDLVVVSDVDTDLVVVSDVDTSVPVEERTLSGMSGMSCMSGMSDVELSGMSGVRSRFRVCDTESKVRLSSVSSLIISSKLQLKLFKFLSKLSRLLSNVVQDMLACISFVIYSVIGSLQVSDEESDSV